MTATSLPGRLARLLVIPVFLILKGVLGLALLLAGFWGAAAIQFSGLPWSLLRDAGSIGFGLWALAAFGAVGQRWRVVAGFVLAVAALAIWWSLKKPSLEGDYPPETSQLASAEFDGDRVTIHNVRNFDYRSNEDFDERWETRSYDLSKVKTVDLVLSHWDSQQTIAHTFLSFVFEGGEYLAVSVEVRRRNDQEYGTIQGLFKQYSLIYVWADERDVIRLRTNYRGEDVYVYPTVSDPPGARKMLVSMLERTNQLATDPVFYNTLGQNCTTTLVDHVNEIMPGAIPYNQSLLMNGFSDAYAYKLGWIDSKDDFLETKARCMVDARARAADQDPDFSKKIRTHIPNR